MTVRHIAPSLATESERVIMKINQCWNSSDAIKSTVGNVVGTGVGASVGKDVGAAVGISVGAAVGVSAKTKIVIML